MLRISPCVEILDILERNPFFTRYFRSSEALFAENESDICLGGLPEMNVQMKNEQVFHYE